MGDKLNLTQSERATYQSLKARGFSHEEALEDALDGVDVETVRENNLRKGFTDYSSGSTHPDCDGDTDHCPDNGCKRCQGENYDNGIRGRIVR